MIQANEYSPKLDSAHQEGRGTTLIKSEREVLLRENKSGNKRKEFGDKWNESVAPQIITNCQIFTILLKDFSENFLMTFRVADSR